MEPVGSISRQAKDPEAKIEMWFNIARLEMFAARFEQLPDLWHVQHIDCDGISPKSPEYLRLLASLGEPCAGEPRARVSCAKGLCRVFCRLLRQKLRWAATKSLLDGTGEESALGMLPHWARQAERYMRYLPLLYLNTEQELNTGVYQAEKTARAQSNKEKREQEQKSKEPSKNTDKQQPRTRNSSTTSQGNSSDNGNNKGSRPPPALVPIAPKRKPSQYTAGRLLMQRVVCGMRRAAKIHGLGRRAAAVVAREIGNQEAQVHALWSSMRVLAIAKLEALLTRGDGRAETAAAHLSSLDWAVADLLMMYELSPVQESSFHEYKQQLALTATFRLVLRFQLETAERDLPPHKWHEAARWYCKTGAVMSPVGLQRRWHELKAHTARGLRAGAGGAVPVHPLHRLIAKKYPHVVSGRLRPWSELLAAGLVARPTDERGARKRQNIAANNESTEKDNSPVIRDKETNTLAGDKAEVSGEKSRDPSVRPGPSTSVRIIDHSPLQATSGSVVSSEEISYHVHTNEVENRHHENTRGEGYQHIDIKEIIDLDAPRTESEELKRFQRLDDRSASNIDTEVVKEDFKNNIDVNKEIIDLDAPNPESEELKRFGLDDRSASNIDTEVVKKEDFKNKVDVNINIIDLDAPSAEFEELKRFQGLDERSASNMDTKVVKKEDFKNNIDVNKEIIDLDAPNAESEELKMFRGLDDRSASNIDTEVVKEKDFKNNIDVNNEIIDLDAPSDESDEFKSRQGLDDRNAFNIVKKVVKGGTASKAISLPKSDDFAKQVIRAIEQELFCDRDINRSSECTNEANSNIVQTNEVKNRHIENTRGEGYKNNIDINKEIIDLDAPSAQSNELKRTQVLDDRNASNIVKEVVEGRITSKANNTPNSDDFAPQVIRVIEKEIFYKGSSKFSKNNECNTTQNCANVSNSKIQPSSKGINNDGIENVTSSSQINTNESHSSVADAAHKNPMLSQMLQTVCIFDDDAELNAFLNKNKEVYRKDNSSNTDVTSNTNVHENKIKSLVENKTRKRVRAKLPDDWADLVRAIKRQRLESAKLENPQINNLIEKEPSKGNVAKRNKKSRSGVSAMSGKTKSKDTENSKSVTNLESNDELYFFNVSSDEEDTSQDSDVREHSIDPKLLMYPVVVMTLIENDPSLRIVSKLPPLPTSRSPSPNLSNLILESSSLPDIKLESPSPSDIKLEKLDDRVSGAEDTPTPEILNEKTKALLKLCKPCEVLLERLEEVDKGIGRFAKRVELQDIDEVRRTNRRVLTAQVAPLAQDSESSSSDSRDSDWTPNMDTTRKKITNENSDSIADSDSETDGGDDDDENDDDEIIKPEAKDLKNPDDHLKQLLNDFVDGPADAECCRRNKRTLLRGELAVTASLAMKHNCARCLWQLLSLPPSSASEAHLQRRLLRHTVLQATSTAPKITEIPKQIPSGTKQIPSGTKQIPSGTKQIPSGTKQIPSGTKQIPSGTKQIPSGTKQIPSGTKQIPKQIACPRSKKISLPASPASQPATNAAPVKQYQRIASAADRPLPAHSPRRTNTAKQVKLAPKEPAGPSIVPKNPKRRGSASLFRPGVVADINEKLGKLVEKPPPAPSTFDPIITSVLSLAPPQPKNKKCPLVPKNVKLVQNNLAQTARNVVEKPPATNVRHTDSVSTSFNVPKPSLNHVAIPSNSAQPHFNTLQLCNAAQSYNSQSAQFERDATHCLNVSNALQPPMNHSTPQHLLPGTTQLPPAVQTVVGQMGSQNFALQGTANVMFDPNTVAGNVMQAPGYQNAPWNIQGNCAVTRETSAFQPVMPVNAKQPNPMYIQSNQPNPMQINQNQPNSMYTQPNQANPMYIQPNQPKPIYIQPNQPNPMHIQPNHPNPMLNQQNQANPMQINQNQPNLMYIQPNQPNPMQINQNQTNPMYIQPNQPNPMQINQNQPNTMYIQPNQPNPMQINQNQPWNNQGNCLVKQETSAFQPVMPINANQPNSMYMNPNQPNPIYINPNQPELMNIQPNQPNLIRPNPMYINTNQSNAMHSNPNQPNSIYPNQMYVNPNQPNPMQINPNQPNPIYPTPMHVNPNQSNPLYIDQNQLNLMNPTQINQPIMCPDPMPIKTEQGSSYLPPISHPNPYGTDSGYSPTVPMLGNSSLTSISQPNAFNPTNAGSLQTFFNSMQEPSQPQSQSYQRPPPPSYDEALAGLPQGSIQVDNKQGPSQFEDSKPSMLAVDVEIGYCDSGNELYDKNNTFARMEWYGRPLPSHKWVVGRDPSRLVVLCTGAHRNPWALLGRYLVLSDEEPPPPNFDVWALNPRVRLLLPHEKEDSATDASAAKPARLQVKSFARAGPSEAEKGQARRHAYAKVKLSDNPAVYAKLLVSVPTANVCRQLLKRGGAIQLYDIQTYLLHPILSKSTGPDSQFSLSGEAPLFPALQELARQLRDD